MTIFFSLKKIALFSISTHHYGIFFEGPGQAAGVFRNLGEYGAGSLPCIWFQTLSQQLSIANAR